MDEALVCDFCHKVVQPLRLCACPLCVDFRLNAGLRPEELRTSVGLRSCDECYAELHEDSLLTATTPPPGPATSSGRKDDQAEDKTQNPNDDESYRDGDGVVADLQSELRDLKEALTLSERQRSETDSEHAREIATLKNGIKKQKEKAEGLQAELRTQINGQRSVIESLKKERDGLSSRLEQQISKAEERLSAKDATMSAKLRSAEEKLSATRRELDTVKDRLSKEAQRSREARDQATQERAAKEEKLSQELVAAQKKSSDLERSCEHWQSTASGYERELALATEKQDRMIEEGIARKSEALRSTLEREVDKRVKAQVGRQRQELFDKKQGHLTHIPLAEHGDCSSSGNDYKKPGVVTCARSQWNQFTAAKNSRIFGPAVADCCETFSVLIVTMLAGLELDGVKLLLTGKDGKGTSLDWWLWTASVIHPCCAGRGRPSVRDLMVSGMGRFAVQGDFETVPYNQKEEVLLKLETLLLNATEIISDTQVTVGYIVVSGDYTIGLMAHPPVDGERGGALSIADSHGTLPWSDGKASVSTFGVDQMDGGDCFIEVVLSLLEAHRVSRPGDMSSNVMTWTPIKAVRKTQREGAETPKEAVSKTLQVSGKLQVPSHIYPTFLE